MSCFEYFTPVWTKVLGNIHPSTTLNPHPQSLSPNFAQILPDPPWPAFRQDLHCRFLDWRRSTSGQFCRGRCRLLLLPPGPAACDPRRRCSDRSRPSRGVPRSFLVTRLFIGGNSYCVICMLLFCILCNFFYNIF